MTREKMAERLKNCVIAIWAEHANDEGIISRNYGDFSDYIWNIIYQIDREVEDCKKHLDIHYCKEDDMTFLIESVYDGDRDGSVLISQECVGWYYGEPTEENTKTFYKSLKADYNSENYHRGKE